MCAPDAAELRVMENQVGEFRALLYQVNLGQTSDLFMEAVHTDQFGEHDSGIVETERLVKIASQKILLHHICYPFLLSCGPPSRALCRPLRPLAPPYSSRTCVHRLEGRALFS